MIKEGKKQYGLLNWLNMNSLMRLMYQCYRKGVLDACEMNDDFFCQEFVDRHTENGTYGVLYLEGDMSRNEWIFTLYMLCREKRMFPLYKNYLEEVRSSQGMYGVTFPILMDFYLLGVKAWLEYPNPIRRGPFMHEKRTKWMPTRDGRPISFTWIMLVDYTQRFCFDRKRHIENQSEHRIRPEAWEDFALAVRCVADKENRKRGKI